MKKWYYILVKNKLYRLEKKMIDKEEIKKVSDTIEIVKSNIEEYEILYSNLLKGNADEQDQIQASRRRGSARLSQGAAGGGSGGRSARRSADGPERKGWSL